MTTKEEVVMGKHVAAQRRWSEEKRVLRTAVQVLVSSVVVLGSIATIAPQVLEAVSDILPGPWLAWLTATIATLTGISAALARIMAIPAVNSWLIAFGIGSVPASAPTPANVGRKEIPEDSKTMTSKSVEHRFD